MNLVTGIAVTILFLIPIRVLPANCSALDEGSWRGSNLAIRSQDGTIQSSFPIPPETVHNPHPKYVVNEVDEHAMEVTGQEFQFRRIEQPIELKIAVTLGGLILIGLEVWWFLLSQTRGD